MAAIPAAADGVTVTAPASLWGNATWVELTASASADLLLLAVITRGSPNVDWEVEIGVGASSSEVVIATLTAYTNDGLGSIGQLAQQIFPIPVDAIPSGSRVAARIRQGNTAATSWRVSIQVAAKPIEGLLETTAQVAKVSPTAATKIATGATGSPAWANGTWAQFVASTSAAWVIFSISARGSPDGGGSGSGDSFEIDIGTGGAGAETAIWTWRGRGPQGAGDTKICAIHLPNPLDNIASSTRIAIRCRKSSTAGAVRFGCSYFEKPL